MGGRGTACPPSGAIGFVFVQKVIHFVIKVFVVVPGIVPMTASHLSQGALRAVQDVIPPFLFGAGNLFHNATPKQRPLASFLFILFRPGSSRIGRNGVGHGMGDGIIDRVVVVIISSHIMGSVSAVIKAGSRVGDVVRFGTILAFRDIIRVGCRDIAVAAIVHGGSKDQLALLLLLLLLLLGDTLDACRVGGRRIFHVSTGSCRNAAATTTFGGRVHGAFPLGWQFAIHFLFPICRRSA